MSHINVRFRDMGNAGSMVAGLGHFDKGVVFCKESGGLSDGQSPYMKNLVYDKNMLRTRFGKEKVWLSGVPTGNLHSYCENMFFGRLVFHIGSSLFTFDGKSGYVICEGMPDCESIVFEMNSTLYFFCREARIFMVDKNFGVSEYVIPTVKVMTDAKYNLTEYTELELPDNMLGFRISVDYREKAAGMDSYTLPCEADEEYPIIFTSAASGNVLDISYTVNGSILEISRELYGACNISFVPAVGTRYREFDKIFGCRRVCTYGGRASGGTRVFFSGNDDYPGYYFYSELLSPLEIRKFSYDILGSGNENVTALLRQRDELIALCERGVYAITYSFGEQSGAVFNVREISPDTGCDIPGSARLVDNRVVFANSRSGIHIIASSEYTDELSVRSISANINGVYPAYGFLSFDAKQSGSFISADFGRRYYLICPSGNAYVWDYGNSPYTLSRNPKSSEECLCWYFFDGFYEKALFEISGELFGIRQTDSGQDFVRLSDDITDDFGEPIQYVFESRNYDFGDAFSKKIPREIYLNAVGKNGTQVYIGFTFDGKLLHMEPYTFRERDEESEVVRRICMRIPGYETYRASFSVIGTGGQIGLCDGAVRVGRKKIYHK